jgi:hypothetical protein
VRFELREGWFSFLREPLPSGRASHSPGLCEHYTLLDRSLLPELERSNLDGTLRWLTPLSPALDARMVQYRPSGSERARLATLLPLHIATCRTLGLELPATFVELLGSETLQDRFRAPTCCYFELSSRLLPFPEPLGGHLLRFFNDWHGVLFWYLWLRTGKPATVIASYECLDDWEPIEEPVLLVASGPLDEFLYRWWIEAHLVCAFVSRSIILRWYSRLTRRPLRRLTSAETAYVAALRRLRSGPMPTGSNA